MTRPWLSLLFLGVGAVVIAAAAPARASSELAEDVKALRAARGFYGRVVPLKPRLLERGERLPLALPPDLLNPKESSCATVSVLGVRGTHFVVRFSELDPGAPNSAFPESSVAGAIEVTRCGAAKPYLAGLSIELRSPRAVLETLLSISPAGSPPLTEILPNRDPGAELDLGDPGPRPAGAPLAERSAKLEARARRTAATSFERETLLATSDGSGGIALVLGAGCHELTLLDATPLGHGVPPVDLDLEVLEDETSPPLALDRAEDADASANLCFGQPTSVELRFVGATPGGRVLYTHARWDLPSGLPDNVSPDARGRLAHLAEVAHFRPQRTPLYEAIGIQGTTELPFEVEPDACYTALLVPLHGDVQSLSLSVIARAVGQAPRGAQDPSGSAVSFCARGATHAMFEVDSRGTSSSWLVAAWETGRLPAGAPEP